MNFRTTLCLFLILFGARLDGAQVVGGLHETIDLRLGGNNYITGTVFGPSGRPVDRRMRIRLSTPASGEHIASTDAFGQFIFAGLPAGLYTMSIDREDEFEPVSQTVEIVRDRESIRQAYPVTIRLRERAKTPVKPQVVLADNIGVPKPALSHYEKAIELAKAGDPRAAIEQLRLAIAAYPAFMNAFNELGVQHMRLNELEKADEALQAALKIKPDAFEPLVNRGIVLFRMSRFSDAEQVLVAALKLKDAAVGRYYLGRTYLKLGRNADAEKALRLSLELGGEEFKEAHRLLAVIYLDRGERARVVEELEAYLRLVPATPDAAELRQVIEQNKGGSGASVPDKKPVH